MQHNKKRPRECATTHEGRSRPETGGPAPRTIISLLRLACNRKGGIFMKFSITMPDGRQLYFEWTRREPISYERFIAVCVLIGVLGSMAMFVFLLTH